MATVIFIHNIEYFIQYCLDPIFYQSSSLPAKVL